MSERFTTYPATLILLLRDDHIFLVQRAGTGYKDGFWVPPSGHIEAGETPEQGAVREAMEEAGVTIREQDLTFVYSLYRMGYGGRNRTYCDYIFKAESWQGEPHNAEPSKASAAGWFPLNNLPTPMLEAQHHILQDYLKGNRYSAIGENEAS
jgi:8-oxo-dGTP diphosphatase